MDLTVAKKPKFSANPSLNLVWVDCEMTGLNSEVGKLIEIAVIITDKDLNVLAEGPNLVIHQPKEIMDNMNEWCIKQHGQSGLTEKVLKSDLSTEDCESKVLEFVKAWTPQGKCPLAGNSIGQDAKFLQKQMPKLMEHLHYRVVDVSTIKELVKRWYTNDFSAPPKKMSHRALDDIMESIEELKYYRKEICKNQEL
jgi:oligoribonuclease